MNHEYDKVNDVQRCLSCGAILYDVESHEQFHKTLKDIVMRFARTYNEAVELAAKESELSRH